jgi:CheY-like chemotaxis protein
MEMRLPEDLKILLAEDSQVNQRITVLMLNQLGLKCDIASNGKEAFELYQQKLYDLVLMDMHMPVMGGLESARKIRAYETHLQLPRAYIVALTASETSDKKSVCIEAGMDEFMEKPIRAEWLRNLIFRSFQYGMDVQPLKN